MAALLDQREHLGGKAFEQDQRHTGAPLQSASTHTLKNMQTSMLWVATGERPKQTVSRRIACLPMSDITPPTPDNRTAVVDTTTNAPTFPETATPEGAGDVATSTGLSDLLKNLGVTAERMNEVLQVKDKPSRKTSTNHRKVHTDAIKLHYKEMITENGAACQSAATVLAWLIAKGMGRTAIGQVMRGANAMGDALGDKGLGLPFIVMGGKKRYALNYAESPAGEKEAAQEGLNTLSETQLAALPYA